MYFAIYIAVLLALGAGISENLLRPEAQRFVLVLGAIGIWRYGWGTVHFIRSLVYRVLVFPRWRRQSLDVEENTLPAHVYLLITSFRIPTATTIRVYRAAIREAARSGLPVTVVASIVEKADEILIKTVHRTMDPPARVRICFVRIPGTGKRDALAQGFSSIGRMNPPDDAVVAVVDGDSILTENCVRQCVSLFHSRPTMGALTTDEICEVPGDDRATGIYRRWYSMRFAQRHILMSSMGLARRVLTLTGRMSMFRASIVIDPGFIDTIQNDHIDHWRLGRFRFLTGDDKSSWYYLLREGWEMGYVPDVQIVTVEEPPHRSFFVGATMLMMRWFGNMLRTNARALTVPRATMGFFVWWSLVDQRLSMWTSLLGISAAMLATTLIGVDILIAYLFWVMLTRMIQTTMLLSARPGVSASYPFLLYFNQIYGSLVKIYMLSHLNRQKWTRQKTTLGGTSASPAVYLQRQLSNVTLATSVLIMIGFIGFAGGFFGWGEITNFVSNFSSMVEFDR